MFSKTNVFLASLVVSSFAAPNNFERAGCTTNSCLSALASRTATARPDCSSFLATTVTPCVKTIKTTVTLTSTLGCSFTGSSSAVSSSVASSACPASVTPSVIPAYASGVCPSNAAYASACGCINARAIKTTLPASTTTATIYQTVKANPTFYVKQVSGGFYPNYYVSSRTEPGVQPEGGPLSLTRDNATPEYWTLAANGTVFGGNGTVAWTSEARNCYGCYDFVYELPIDASNVPMTCKLGTKTGDFLPLTCKNSRNATIFQNCSPDGDNLDMGGSPNTEFHDCFVAKLGAFPVCS